MTSLAQTINNWRSDQRSWLLNWEWSNIFELKIKTLAVHKHLNEFWGMLQVVFLEVWDCGEEWVAQPWPLFISVTYSRLSCGGTFKGAASHKTHSPYYMHTHMLRNRPTTAARLVYWPLIYTSIHLLDAPTFKINFGSGKWQTGRQTDEERRQRVWHVVSLSLSQTLTGIHIFSSTLFCVL